MYLLISLVSLLMTLYFYKSSHLRLISLSTPIRQNGVNHCSFLTTRGCWCSALLIGNTLDTLTLFPFFPGVRCCESLVENTPSCIYTRSIHNKVTKFYIGCQPIVTLPILFGLGYKKNILTLMWSYLCNFIIIKKN